MRSATVPAVTRDLILWLGKHKATVRVSMEATGIYSLDVALALEGKAGIEVAVLNPKLVTVCADATAIEDRCRRCGGAG